MWVFRVNGHFVLSCTPVLLERKFGVNRHFVGIYTPVLLKKKIRTNCFPLFIESGTHIGFRRTQKSRSPLPLLPFLFGFLLSWLVLSNTINDIISLNI